MDALSQGARLQQLRASRKLSVRELARRLSVSESAVRHWEQGRNSWDRKKELEIASVLHVSKAELRGETPGTAVLSDTVSDLGLDLSRFLRSTESTVYNTRLCMAYVQPPRVQSEFRSELSRRLLAGDVAVHQVEIIFSIDRIKELAYNIELYQESNYHVKLFERPPEIIPMMNMWSFDHEHFIIGGHHQHVPPTGVPGLVLQGDAFKAYFTEFWNTLWQQSTPLTDIPNPIRFLLEQAQQLGASEPDLAEIESAGQQHFPVPPRV